MNKGTISPEPNQLQADHPNMDWLSRSSLSTDQQPVATASISKSTAVVGDATAQRLPLPTSTIDDSVTKNSDKKDIHQEDGMKDVVLPPRLHDNERALSNTTVMRLDDPNRMKVTSREFSAILEIRKAVESIPEIDNLSDFWYAQLGVICCLGGTEPKSCLENALYRILGLQVFRERYDITNSLAEGTRAMEWMVETFPSLFMHWGLGAEEEQDGIIIGNWRGNEFFELLDTPAKVDKFMVAMYYFQKAMSPDLYTIRKGPICAWNIHQFGFSWMFRMILMRVGTELVAFNPVAPRNKCYRTNVFYDVCITMFKKLVAKEFSDRIEVRLTPSDQLETIFGLDDPTPQSALETVMPNIAKCLERRAENERTFVLPTNQEESPSST